MKDVEKEYCHVVERYNNKVQEQNNLLIKIVSVTDYIVKQQLQEEYAGISEELDNIEVYKKELEPKYIKYISDALLDDFTKFYSRNFKEISLIEAFATYNINLVDLEKKYKLRPIRNLNQKRELCLLMNDIKRQIKIVDYCNTTIDIIGKYDDANPIIIITEGFANISATNKIISLQTSITP